MPLNIRGPAQTPRPFARSSSLRPILIPSPGPHPSARAASIAGPSAGPQARPRRTSGAPTIGRRPPSDLSRRIVSTPLAWAPVRLPLHTNYLRKITDGGSASSMITRIFRKIIRIPLTIACTSRDKRQAPIGTIPKDNTSHSIWAGFSRNAEWHLHSARVTTGASSTIPSWIISRD